MSGTASASAEFSCASTRLTHQPTNECPNTSTIPLFRESTNRSLTLSRRPDAEADFSLRMSYCRECGVCVPHLTASGVSKQQKRTVPRKPWSFADRARRNPEFRRSFLVDVPVPADAAPLPAAAARSGAIRRECRRDAANRQMLEMGGIPSARCINLGPGILIGQHGVQHGGVQAMPATHRPVGAEDRCTRESQIAYCIQHLVTDELVGITQSLGIDDTILTDGDRILE